MEIASEFKIPILYNIRKQTLNSNILEELELLETYDASSSNSISTHIYGEKTEFKATIQRQLVETYTTDTGFLKDQQKMLNRLHKTRVDELDEKSIVSIWKEVKECSDFKEKYCYVELEMGSFLNESTVFLQLLSILNLTSPIISFCVPFIILLIPFFVIKAKQLEVTFEQYIEILEVIASQHAIGKLFTEFNNVRVDQKCYLVASAAFYVFSIYQNVLLCVKFFNNMKKIHEHFYEIANYIHTTIIRMDSYIAITSKLSSHTLFNDKTNDQKEVLASLQKTLNSLSRFECSFTNLCEIGGVLRLFYDLHVSETLNKAFLYSFGFNGYLDNMVVLASNLHSRKMNCCTFVKKRRSSVLTDSYYAVLKDEKHVKNNILLNKNIVITGPNASGKTTTLKATFINVILSQQIACGFYSKATIKPFQHFHCYMNIPDTSARDSLFQAEARRCKGVIDSITKNKGTHFCIFDELYSGTNPEEAVSSAFGLMKYFAKKNNVTFLLTTHYVLLCSKLDKVANISNFMMDSVIDEKKKLHHTYNLESGISAVKGGTQVLTNMKYPEEIISSSVET